MRVVIFSILLAFAACMASAQSDRIVSEGAARDYCDHATLHRIEGIWEFPEDDTRVLLRRQPDSRYRYQLIVLESPDCRMTPGESIANVNATADPNKFEIRFLGGNRLSHPVPCVGLFNDKDGAFYIESAKLSLKIRTGWFLPGFWKAVRFGLGNPAGKLPKGMVRIYPQSIREPLYF